MRNLLIVALSVVAIIVIGALGIQGCGSTIIETPLNSPAVEAPAATKTAPPATTDNKPDIVPISVLDQLKFEVDYLKYLAVLAGAGIALAGVMHKQISPSPWQASASIFAFLVALFFVTCGYAYKNLCVLTLSKSNFMENLCTLLFGPTTALAFFYGAVLLIIAAIQESVKARTQEFGPCPSLFGNWRGWLRWVIYPEKKG